MEHVIEQVAQRLHSSYCECEGWYPECQGPQVGDRRVARRLAAEGLLAPAPLREEQPDPGPVPPVPGGRIYNSWQLAHVLSEQLDDAAPLNMHRRWVPLADRLWTRLPVARAEGDGSADQ